MFHYYTPDRLEKKAEEILSNYLNGALLLKPQAMDVDHFAEFYCGASIDFVNLSQNKQTLGCSCFNDGVLMVWNDMRTKEIPIAVSKGSILIDKDLLDSEVEGRIRFTIIHECSHLILHPRFYYQKPGLVIPKIECTVYHIENWIKRPPITDEEIREWQANRLGAALIIPMETVKMLLADRLGIGLEKLAPVCVSDQLITEIAAVYKVSRSAMTNRLRELNLLLQ